MKYSYFLSIKRSHYSDFDRMLNFYTMILLKLVLHNFRDTASNKTLKGIEIMHMIKKDRYT
jgi:hypothetical protein